MDTQEGVMSILVLLAVYIITVSGLVPEPHNLQLDMWDGEVRALWDHPMEDTSEVEYTVQMSKYFAKWGDVSSCTRIRVTQCNLTSLIDDYQDPYKMRVRVIMGKSVSKWAVIKKFQLTDSKLLAPSFSLVGTSSTLTVKVYQKPILKKLFLFGMTYTIYLEEKGQGNKNITAYLNSDQECCKTFKSLQWGREYCVSLQVVGNGALLNSKLSQQCLRLPEQEWYLIAVSSLSILGVLTVVSVMLFAIFCFLRRSEKTPISLKSTRTGWSPLTVGEGNIEVVTDKGWFLHMLETDVKSWFTSEPEAPQTIAQEKEERKNERRTSMDSGVSLESNCAKETRVSDHIRREDSGCTSIEGSQSPESYSGTTEERRLQERRTDENKEGKNKDSGIGLGSQLDCTRNPEGQGSGFLPGRIHCAGDNYQRQDIRACDGDKSFKQVHFDLNSVSGDVVSGYRKGQVSCVCSAAGLCAYCQTNHGPVEVRQYRTACATSSLLNRENNNLDSSGDNLTFSNYCRKTHIQMETVVSVDDSEAPANLNPIEFEEALPMFWTHTLLPSVQGELSWATTAVSISLCDVELKTD